MVQWSLTNQFSNGKEKIATNGFGTQIRGGAHCAPPWPLMLFRNAGPGRVKHGEIEDSNRFLIKHGEISCKYFEMSLTVSMVKF